MKIIFTLTALALHLILAGSLQAAVLTVTTKDDTNDGVCDSHCSLREALGAVTSGGDTIIFARDLRGTTIQLTRTLETNGRPFIDGPNKRRITLRGNGTFRILRTRGITQIDGLIITDGGELESEGGGIYNTGTLNLLNCLVTNNKAANGGGIYSLYGTVWIYDSSIAGNASTAQDSTGGVELFRSSTRIVNSTISGNLSQSTNGGAGGVRFVESPNWFINGSTIAYNISNSTVDGSAGGFVPFRGTPGPIANTILAKNTGFNPDYYGWSSGAKNSLIGITDSRSGFHNGVNGCIVGSAANPVDPQLGLLSENGGRIPTHALLNTSHAIDAGGNTLLINSLTDQRGFNRIVNTTVDIGAFEYDSQPAETFSTITGRVTNASGRGISGARIKLRSSNGEERFAVTNPFGYYRFINVINNLTYTVECNDKRFPISSKEILIEENLEYVDFLLGSVDVRKYSRG